jgi:hypothetical protein
VAKGAESLTRQYDVFAAELRRWPELYQFDLRAVAGGPCQAPVAR